MISVTELNESLRHTTRCHSSGSYLLLSLQQQCVGVFVPGVADLSRHLRQSLPELAKPVITFDTFATHQESHRDMLVPPFYYFRSMVNTSQ